MNLVTNAKDYVSFILTTQKKYSHDLHFTIWLFILRPVHLYKLPTLNCLFFGEPPRRQPDLVWIRRQSASTQTNVLTYSNNNLDIGFVHYVTHKTMMYDLCVI